MPDGTRVTIALPNKGRLHDNTVAFLEKCALKVKRDNARQYQSTMSGAGTVFEPPRSAIRLS